MSVFGRGQREAQQGQGAALDAEALKAHIRHQMVVDLARGVTKLSTDVCFDACLGPKFDTGITQHQQRCVQLCTERFMDGFAIIEKKFDQVSAMYDHNH